MHFFFYINFDKHGFYVEPGLGNRTHTHHSPLNGPSKQKNKRELAQDERELINDMAEGRHRTFKYKMLYLTKLANSYLPSQFVRSPGTRKDRL